MTAGAPEADERDAEPAAADPDELSGILGHRFQDPALLREALTHQSALPGGARGSYQRLEFLGDRVLGLVIAELLLKRFPAESEGALARRLAALVRQETLAEVAAGLGLDRFVILSRAEAEAGGARNPALLSDSCEAVIGALYLDGGLAVAEAFVLAHWTALLEAERAPPRDAKTTLQEWAQGRGLPLPDYREVGRSGPDHDPVFTVEASVAGQAPARGEGRSKRLAEQAAAAALLEVLGQAGGGRGR